MKSGGFFSSNLFSLHHVVQNTQLLYPKELIIGTLREYFSKDVKYHYVQDEWGFPKTPDHTDLDPKAGLNDSLTTRIYIGQEGRESVPFYPAVLVKITSSNSIPISFNQEEGGVQYTFLTYEDGCGQQYQINVPQYLIIAAAWDIGMTIEVLAEGSQDRSTIAEAISVYLMTVVRNQLTRAGLFIKTLKTGGETSEIYQNNNIFKIDISLDCRGELRRHIPVLDVADVINICGDIGREIGLNQTFNPAPNMTINQVVDLES